MGRPRGIRTLGSPLYLYMDANLIEALVENGMWYLYLVSLISADTLTDLEACQASLYNINQTIAALPEANIPEDVKTKSLEVLQSGIQIVERDMKRFSNPNN